MTSSLDTSLITGNPHIWRCGRGLHVGRVAAPGPCSEGPVPGRDAGEPQQLAVCGWGWLPGSLTRFPVSGLSFLSFWKLWSVWCSVSSLAQKKWVYSPFCEKSLDSVGCEIVLASHVAFCCVHRPQGKLTGTSLSFLMNRFSSKHTRGTLQIGSRRTMDDGWWNPLSNPFRWVRD